jgi:copper resistance protein B
MEVIMHIKFLSLIAVGVLILSPKAQAEGEHGNEIYHAVTVELEGGQSNHGDDIIALDIDGWIGTDENRFAFKSEGERANGETESLEFWGMYSRMVSTFWNAQIGIRHDTQPLSTTYAVLGIEGLAPYFFETEAHLFISDEGDVSARVRQENDFLVTQKLILQPYVEANLYAQDVSELDIGAGLSDAEFGVQTRYEYTRGFAPYVDVRYERKFGETSSIAKSNGEDNDAVVGSIGVKLLF